MRRYFTAIVILAVFSCGCAEKKPSSPEVKSHEAGIIDYMIGGEQIKTYKRTESKIKNIDKTLKERFQGF